MPGQDKPASPTLVRPSVRPLGLYLHVPFCATACDFCAFYTEEPHREELDRYLDAMEREFALRPPDRPVRTVFWGGGTPSLLPARDLGRLGAALRRHLPGPAPEEWTVEMAPSTVKADKLAVLRDLGVTRLSLGVQSFSPRWLEALGRRQGPEVVIRALEAVRAAGFENINLDLMFALPGQSLADWEQDLRAALAWDPVHLSTYCLTFEDDTKLWAKLQRGQVQARSIAEEARFYEFTFDYLGAAGLPAYEISNYARPGFACQHNLDTWAMAEWLGYGPSAASQWHGRRWANAANLETWRQGVEAGRPAEVDIVPLTPETMAGDAIVFGLRRTTGVDLAELRDRFPDAPWPVLEGLLDDLADEGLLTRTDDLAALTPPGRLVADAIGTAVLERLDAASEDGC